MLYAAFSRVLGRYLLYLSAILILPLGVAGLYEFYLEPHIVLPVSASIAFLTTIGLTLSAGLLLLLAGRCARDDSLRRKESFLLVASIWFLTAAIGSLPFILTKVMDNPVDAYFEAMSGLTTTGATIIEPKAYDPKSGIEIPVTMKNPLEPHISYTFYGTVKPLKDQSGTIVGEGIEALGKPLLFWRSLLSWLGGIGVVVLFVAILPALAVGGKFLFESEVAGPSKEGMTPRIKETAGILWKVYILLTLMAIGFIYFSDSTLGFFNAVILAFGTVSTGGFYNHNSCLSINLNVITSAVIIVFMVIGGINFSLFYHVLRKKTYRLRDPELLMYLVILFVAALLMAGTLWKTSTYAWGDSLYYGLFQSISALTSTGFSFVDYDEWPMAAQILIVILMYIGAMSGSTSGGIKIIRYIIAWKAVVNKIEQFFRPEAVRVIQVSKKEISDKTASTVLAFFFLMLFSVIVGTYLLVIDNIDPTTAIGIISSTINNNGLYFGGIGCTSSLGFLSDYSKIVAILSMIFGRLEFFSLLVLLTPSFWKS